MISKNKLKFIKSLHDKKNRNDEWVFLVEWEKSLVELLSSNFEILDLIISEDFYLKYRSLVAKFSFDILNSDEITHISTLKTNSYWVAVVKQKENNKIVNNNEYILILDDIKDPGNFWTIIRIADWYWIKKIICSNNTVDFYNPKVIISTMGSFSRVEIYYTDLVEYLQHTSLPIYWSFMEWENIHKTTFATSWFIVIWNESNGICPEIEKLITKKITILKFGQAESLNAGIATAVLLDNLKRAQ